MVEDRAARARPHSPAGWLLLVVLEVLVAVNALYGGIGLIVNGMGMPPDWLAGTPFGSWAIPGVLLILLVAAPMAGAAIVELAGGRRAGQLSMIAGAVLVGWIVAQVVILRHYFILQPILFAVGVLIVALARLVPHRRPRGR
jgi:hypothetical protein